MVYVVPCHGIRAFGSCQGLSSKSVIHFKEFAVLAVKGRKEAFAQHGLPRASIINHRLNFLGT